jgi:hypothetical protein
MDTLLIILVLQIKHWYADFYVQSYNQTVRKGIYRDPVGISHTIDHVIGTLTALVILIPFINISPITILLCGLLDLIIHYHVDWTKVKFGSKDINTPQYWREFGADQLAHQLTYLLFAYLLTHR